MLRDVTQVSCLFLSVEAAAELAGVAVPADQQQQEQLVLLAAAAAAAAVDETLEVQGAYSADDIDEEIFGFPPVRLLTNSGSSLDGVMRSGSGGTAAEPGREPLQPRSPVSTLVHKIVAGMFRRLVLEDGCAATGAGHPPSSSSPWAAALDLAELLSDAQQQEQQDAGGLLGQAAAAALVLSSPQLPVGGFPTQPATPAAADSAGRLAPSAVLDKLLAQLEQLGIAQQCSTLRVLCSQLGSSGLLGAGQSVTAAFLQPADRDVGSRQPTMHSLRPGSHMTWQQHQQQHYGVEPGQQQRWWDSHRADQQQQQRTSMRSGQPGYGYQHGAGHGMQYGCQNAASGDRGDAAETALPGLPPTAVGRVYVQQQAQQQQHMVAGVSPPKQYQALCSGQFDQISRHHQQQLQHQQQTLDLAAETDHQDASMASPFERSASLACGIGPGPAILGPPGLVSPMSSSTTGTGFGGLRLVPSNSSGWMSSQANSGAVTSVLGSNASYLSQGSVLPALSSANFGNTSTLNSGAFGSTTITDANLALSASVTGNQVAVIVTVTVIHYCALCLICCLCVSVGYLCISVKHR